MLSVQRGQGEARSKGHAVVRVWKEEKMLLPEDIAAPGPEKTEREANGKSTRAAQGAVAVDVT